MPLNHGGGLHQHEDIQESRPHAVEPDPNQAIDRKKLSASGTPAAQDGELMPERNDLELQFYAAAKPTGEP